MQVGNEPEKEEHADEDQVGTEPGPIPVPNHGDGQGVGRLGGVGICRRVIRVAERGSRSGKRYEQDAGERRQAVGSRLRPSMERI